MTASARIILAALGLAAFVAAAPVRAQDWPTRPLTLVVPFAAGSGTDLVARHLAAPLGERLGQTIVVQNSGGAASPRRRRTATSW
jgi:tripartite-type tricarboxylate transporter receptor subunit TctC